MHILIHALYNNGRTAHFKFDSILGARDFAAELRKNGHKYITWLMDEKAAIELDILAENKEQ